MTSYFEIASNIVYREARYLDERRWDDWLALYHADAEFWAPMWKSEHETTTDPSSEVSLIYIPSSARLQERVDRVRSNKSAASIPLPRTAHSITNLQCDSATAALIATRALSVTYVYDVKRRETAIHYSQVQHEFTCINAQWKIRKKKLVLLNDYLSTPVDFYSL